MEALKNSFKNDQTCETVWFVVDFVSFIYFIGHHLTFNVGTPRPPWV